MHSTTTSPCHWQRDDIIFAPSEHYIRIVKHVDTRCWLRSWIVVLELEDIMNVLEMKRSMGQYRTRTILISGTYNYGTFFRNEK